MFATMAYQGLLKYKISFPLFKVSEPWKFQMSGFWVSTGVTQSSKHFSHSKQNDKMTEQGRREYQISFPLFIVSHKNSECVDFVSTGETHIDIPEVLSMTLCQI